MDTPDEQTDEEKDKLDSPRTPAAGNTDEETELQKIAEAIPTPTNLQPGNLFAPSIFTPSAFMATTTQTTTQTQQTPAGPSNSSGKAATGGSGPREEEEDKACQIRWPTLLGPLKEGIRVAAGEILEEVVIQEEGEAGIQPPPTNSQGNSPLFSKEIAENRKPLYKNGTSIRASIDSPRKWSILSQGFSCSSPS